MRLEVEQIETKVQFFGRRPEGVGKRGGERSEEEKKRGKKIDEGLERFSEIGQSGRRDDRGGVVQSLGMNLSCFVPTNRDMPAIWVRLAGAPIARRSRTGITIVHRLRAGK